MTVIRKLQSSRENVLQLCNQSPPFILMTKQFLDQIESRAERLKLNISAVLSEAGVDYSTWWRWREGKTSPTVKSIMLINEVLDKLERQSA